MSRNSNNGAAAADAAAAEPSSTTNGELDVESPIRSREKGSGRAIPAEDVLHGIDRGSERETGDVAMVGPKERVPSRIEATKGLRWHRHDVVKLGHVHSPTRRAMKQDVHGALLATWKEHRGGGVEVDGRWFG